LELGTRGIIPSMWDLLFTLPLKIGQISIEEITKHLVLFLILSLAFISITFGITYLPELFSLALPAYFVEINEFISEVVLRLPFFETIFFTSLIVIYVIFYQKITSTFFRQRPRNYQFHSTEFYKEWELQGDTNIPPDLTTLHVINSNAGVLLKNKYWKNFILEINLFFPLSELNTGLRKQIGILFRAQSLSDCFMLTISNTKITPHVRINGNYEVMLAKPTNLAYNKSHKLFLEVKASNVNLYLNTKKNLIFTWILPTYAAINHVMYDRSIESKENKFTPPQIIPKIDFRDSEGMIGFRAAPDEESVIIDMSIKKL
jgi:hypothetical protein